MKYLHRYTKIPVEIDVFAWNPDSLISDVPYWFLDSCSNGTLFPEFNGNLTFVNEETFAQPGDYIIKDENGEIDFCVKHIFESCYEEVENEQTN